MLIRHCRSWFSRYSVQTTFGFATTPLFRGKAIRCRTEGLANQALFLLGAKASWLTTRKKAIFGDMPEIIFAITGVK